MTITFSSTLPQTAEMGVPGVDAQAAATLPAGFFADLLRGVEAASMPSTEELLLALAPGDTGQALNDDTDTEADTPADDFDTAAMLSLQGMVLAAAPQVSPQPLQPPLIVLPGAGEQAFEPVVSGTTAPAPGLDGQPTPQAAPATVAPVAVPNTGTAKTAETAVSTDPLAARMTPTQTPTQAPVADNKTPPRPVAAPASPDAPQQASGVPATRQPARATQESAAPDAPDAPGATQADAAAAPRASGEQRARAPAAAAPVALAGLAATNLPASNDTHADAPLSLPPSTPSQWRQPLAEALGERLQLQLGRGTEQALIRLDPPNLGRIDIQIRHEAGGLQVHLSASNGEVLRQLNHIGDSLRQDLVQRQYGEVSVHISERSADGEGRSRSQQGREQEQDPAPNRALAEAEQGLAMAFGMAKDLD